MEPLYSQKYIRMLAIAISITLTHSYRAAAQDMAPVIDNARVRVWEVTGSGTEPKLTGDSIRIFISPEAGRVVFQPKAAAARLSTTGRSIVVELKDAVVAPLENKSGYPQAFPRPGAKKLFENERVIVWDYTWEPGKPSAMHFHDKDVVGVDLANGVVKATTEDHQNTSTEQTVGKASFNPRGRVHTEELVKGQARRILTELK